MPEQICGELGIVPNEVRVIEQRCLPRGDDIFEETLAGINKC